MGQQEIIAELTAKVKEQDEFLKNITEGALSYATIIGHDETFQVIATAQNNYQRVNKFKGGGKVGDLVVIVPMTGQILQISSQDFGTATAAVSRVHGRMVEVDSEGSSRLVVMGEKLKAAKKNDLVLLDHTKSVALRVVEPVKPEPPQFQRVRWDEIAGCSEAKAELQDMILSISGGDKYFEAYGMKAPKGFMLYGPPGNGKTLLSKAVATALDGGFVYMGATELLNMYVGETESRIRGLFQQARAFKASTGRPSVIALDEADALLGKRGTGISSDTNKTIVPAFLTEMDGLADSGAIVMLMTNRPDTLDEAAIRDGRIDRKIHIGLPNPQDQRDILELGLRGAKLQDKLCDCIDAGMGAIGEHKPSGATLVAATHKARQLAARRDRSKGGKVMGLLADDLAEGIRQGL